MGRNIHGRMAGFAALALAAAILVSIPACSYLGSYAEMVREKGVSREYRSALDAWTRTKALHSELETRAEAFATFKSPEFRAASAKAYARLYDLTEEQVRTRREVLEEMASEFDEFFVYVAMPDHDANDFDKSGSIWKIYLFDDRGSRHQPMEIRRINKVTALVTSFYPYVNPYHGNCYTVKFPPGSVPKGKPFRLLFTGVLGGIELAWP